MQQNLFNSSGAGFHSAVVALSNYLINSDLGVKQQSRREAGLKYKFTTE
jgi:hypothetical protein